MKFILNPGDFKVVATLSDEAEAVRSLANARSLDPFARLYRVNGRKLERYLHDCGGVWEYAEQENIPVKVLYAASAVRKKK